MMRAQTVTPCKRIFLKSAPDVQRGLATGKAAE